MANWTLISEMPYGLYIYLIATLSVLLYTVSAFQMFLKNKVLSSLYTDGGGFLYNGSETCSDFELDSYPTEDQMRSD